MTDSTPGRRDPLPAIVFVATLVLYCFTSSRTPGWIDATMILDRARRLVLDPEAVNHNLFNVLGYAWLSATPFIDPHRSLTLLCSLLASLTVLLMHLAAREFTGNRTAAALAAGALALSQSLWWHATMIEVYALNTVLIAAFLLSVFAFLRRGGTWRLYAAFFTFGLGVANHVLVGLYVLAFGLLLVVLLVRRRIAPWHVPLLIVCALAGSSLLLFLIVRRALETGSLLAALDVATGSGSRTLMFPRGLPASQRVFWRLNYLLLLLWNFPSAAIVFIFIGLPWVWKAWPDRTAALFFLAGLAAQVAWSANYLIYDMYAFSLPVYVMAAVPLACGIERFLRRGLQRGRWAVLATFLLPLAFYPALPRLPGRERTIDRYVAMYPESSSLCGFWDPVDYMFNPIRRWDRGLDRFASAWIERMPRGAQYWDDNSKAAVPLLLYYQGIRGQRLDVTVHVEDANRPGGDEAENAAAAIDRCLAAGDPVFISSLVEPERSILNVLRARYSPTRWTAFPLVDGTPFVIYRLER